MRIAQFCFVIAALEGTLGMLLGIQMGISQDFSLAPAHAHANLLGWVTMMLYGLYHRSAAVESGLAWLQAGLGAAGFAVFAIGLGAYLSGHDPAAMPFVIAGSLACLAAMVLFLVIVVRDARGAARGVTRRAGLAP